jgi:hypothetical protein
MKIANLIPVYLAQKKNIELQGLGRFTFIGEAVENSQEDFVFPEGSLHFESDPKAGLSEDLIRFMTEKSGKVRSLVISDLDSFIQLGIQFLNLGKPFEIPGIGQIKRNGQGKIEFIQGEALRSKVELREQPKTEKASQHDNISFRAEKKKGKPFPNKNRFIAILLLVMLIITYLLIANNQKKSAKSIVKTIPPQSDNSIHAGKDSAQHTYLVNVDSSGQPIDSSLNSTARGFRIVVKEYASYSRAAGFKRLLESHHEIIVFTRDSSIFKVAIPFDEPLKDTTRIRDSIRYMLGLPVHVELP